MLCWLKEFSLKLRNLFKRKEDQGLLTSNQTKIREDFEIKLQKLSYHQLCEALRKSYLFDLCEEQILPTFFAINKFLMEEISNEDYVINQFIQLLAENFKYNYGDDL